MTTIDTTTIEPGCYIGSSWGVYGIERLYELRCDLDDTYKDSTKALEDGAIIQHSMSGTEGRVGVTETNDGYTVEDCHDIVSSELFDELTDALPTDPMRPYLVWYWRDGELFYGLPDFDYLPDMAEWYNDTVGELKRRYDEARSLIIEQLEAEGYSQRDIGTVVGVSQQRVGQLLEQSKLPYPKLG